MAVRLPTREVRGFSLPELLTLISIVGILAAITVPLAVPVQGRIAVPLTARHLAVVLRLAQATAQTEDARVRFEVNGSRWSLRRVQGGAESDIVSGALGSLACTTNYPGGWVEFDRRGYPLSVNLVPRAGSFTIRSGGSECSVVLQLTGRVRVR